jgi:hypothetical protein
MPARGPARRAGAAAAGGIRRKPKSKKIAATFQLVGQTFGAVTWRHGRHLSARLLLEKEPKMESRTTLLISAVNLSDIVDFLNRHFGIAAMEKPGEARQK